MIFADFLRIGVEVVFGQSVLNHLAYGANDRGIGFPRAGKSEHEVDFRQHIASSSGVLKSLECIRMLAIRVLETCLSLRVRSIE